MKMQIFTAKIIVTADQEMELSQIMDSSKLITFSNEKVGRVAVLEYTTGTKDEVLAGFIIAKLANAPVIQARARPA